MDREAVARKRRAANRCTDVKVARFFSFCVCVLPVDHGLVEYVFGALRQHNKTRSTWTSAEDTAPRTYRNKAQIEEKSIEKAGNIDSNIEDKSNEKL